MNDYINFPKIMYKYIYIYTESMLREREGKRDRMLNIIRRKVKSDSCIEI